MRKFSKQSGFTLIEVFFAVAVLAVVVFSFYKLPIFFAQSQKSVSTIVTRDRLFKGFSQNFIAIAERADVATRFQNLPIGTSCVKDKPCIRTLEESDRSFSFRDTSLESISSVQFLRDEKGELVDRLMMEGSEVKVRTRAPLVFERNILEKEYYATWPLVDASSEPFVLMRRGEVADHFIMEDSFMTSRVITNWIIVKGSRKGIEVDKLVGHPMLIYNMEDLGQYTAQRVKAAVDCSTPAARSRCEDVARSLNPLFDPAGSRFEITGGEKNKLFAELPFYMMELEPFRESDLRYTNSLQPTDFLSRQWNFLPRPGISPSSWANQDSSLYLFPSEVASMFGGGAEDLAKPVDGKRLGHFIHMLPPDQQGKLALLPFDLISYQMEDAYVQSTGGGKQKDPAGKKVLTLHVLGGKSPEVVLADIESGDQIVFARRLGRAELSVYHLK